MFNISAEPVIITEPSESVMIQIHKHHKTRKAIYDEIETISSAVQEEPQENICL